MNYCRFTNLALERQGWAGVPAFQAENLATLPTLHCIFQAGKREGACPALTMFVHVAPSTCNPDSSAAALWGLREADGSHILHLRVLQNP